MLTSTLLLLLAPFSALARPTLSQRQSPNIQMIHEFPGIVLENLAARSNGHLLISASNQPHLYDINPSASSPTPVTLPAISDVAGLFGIAETAPDVFAVAAGNYTGNGGSETPTPGSFSVWSVDMTTSEPTVKLITTMPDAGGLNGMTALNGFSGNVLIADSTLGGIWKVDVATGSHSMVIQDSHFANTVTGSLGINGLRMFEGSLYFTNSVLGTYGRLPITSAGAAAGTVDILSRSPSTSDIYDDLDLSSAGNAWITTHSNAVTEVTAGGTQTNMTGNGNSFLQPTSARFGRGAEDQTLYVVNAGNTGTGQLVAVSSIVS